MRSERTSLRQRLLLWLLPPILLLTVAWAWASHAIVLRFSNHVHDAWLEDSVRTLASQVHINDEQALVDLPPAARQMLEFDEIDKVFFSVVDGSGRPLIGNSQLPPPPVGNDDAGKAHFYDGQLEGNGVRLVQVTLANVRAGHAIHVRMAETLRKREFLAKEILAYMMAPQALFLGGIVVLIWYGIGRGIAPLRRIRDAIARRTHADLSPLDETGLPTEVHEQVRVINDLMARLGRTIAAQQRFIADATHQLRTPITVLRTQTELALRADDADALRDSVAKLDAATARLARLSNQLLNLSRAEAGLAGSLQAEHVDVTDWVEEVVAALVPAALNKQIEVSVNIADALLVLHGDRQLLNEMLANLVDNAIRYTPPGGRVDVEVRMTGSMLVVTVADNGPGIPVAERQRVLERFYRGSDVSAEGSGLGLAIAHEIVILHRGRIDLATASQASGLRVTVEIPAPATASSSP